MTTQPTILYGTPFLIERKAPPAKTQMPAFRRAERRPPGNAEEALRRLRLLVGMSLEAAAAKLGVTVVQLSEWERGPERVAANKRAGLARRAIMDSLTETQRNEVQALLLAGEEARLDTLDPPDAPGITGTIKCPNCWSALHFAISGSNGHLHMLCETPNCVSRME